MYDSCLWDWDLGANKILGSHLLFFAADGASNDVLKRTNS